MADPRIFQLDINGVNNVSGVAMPENSIVDIKGNEANVVARVEPTDANSTPSVPVYTPDVM